MTSTVLDVGLFLLCVSASVGTVVGVAPPDTGPETHVDDLADRIATETATVSYGTNDGDRRRHHATLVEHLALAALVPEDAGRSERTYRHAVSNAVGKRLDPRTGVTVRVPTRIERSSNDDDGHRTAMTVGGSPPSTARVWTTVVDVPVDRGETTVRVVVRRWDRAAV
ncbi:DUF7284 family protein [Halopenitus persicus]|uniref:Uncharacterized protein n=1 Tax=Halopenitus persicus TaxID=1048396 RepID=A0A1H3G7P5_9EURY|nr:hypothetical protein [Halopenitus persicus]QHS16906.1 hypothetical protein GWK26_06970 [haloarchaeon 3A1-DGR]SDX98379.1 hypothetical protein SAMN05216564_102341 [Halopenitus persicus]